MKQFFFFVFFKVTCYFCTKFILCIWLLLLVVLFRNRNEILIKAEAKWSYVNELKFSLVNIGWILFDRFFLRRRRWCRWKRVTWYFIFVSALNYLNLSKIKRGQMILKVHSRLSFGAIYLLRQLCGRKRFYSIFDNSASTFFYLTEPARDYSMILFLAAWRALKGTFCHFTQLIVLESFTRNYKLARMRLDHHLETRKKTLTKTK